MSRRASRSKPPSFELEKEVPRLSFIDAQLICTIYRALCASEKRRRRLMTVFHTTGLRACRIMTAAAVKKVKFLLVEAALVWMQVALATQERRQTQEERRTVGPGQSTLGLASGPHPGSWSRQIPRTNWTPALRFWKREKGPS